MVYTWRRGHATQSAVSLSQPFAFARTRAPRTPLSPLWWGWIRLKPTAVNICAIFFINKFAQIFLKKLALIFLKKLAQIFLNQNFVEIFAQKFTLFFSMQIFAKYCALRQYI